MHRASITKRAVKGVYSLLQPSLVLQGEPPCWRSELGDMATTWGTEQTPYPKRKQREMGIMSIWHIYDKIFSDPIPGRWIHGEWRSCAPTPTKKKVSEGKVKASCSAICVCAVWRTWWFYPGWLHQCLLSVPKSNSKQQSINLHKSLSTAKVFTLLHKSVTGWLQTTAHPHIWFSQEQSSV